MTKEDDTTLQEVTTEIQHYDDGISAFIGFDFEAFETISNLAEHLGRANMFFAGRENWYLERHASAKVPLLHNNAQAKEDTNTVEHAMIILDALQPAQSAIQQAWFWISEQIDSCKEHISAVKARSGFLAFPDEILSDILEFAACRQDKNVMKAIANTVRAAINLSHVCSRFRRLVVTTVDLWNRVSPLMNPLAIAACLDRCGTSGVDIYISSMMDLDVISPLIALTMCQTNLWRRFIHVCDDLTYSAFSSQVGKLGELCKQSPFDTFPLLSDISVHYPTSALSISPFEGFGQDEQVKVHFYSTWPASGLRSFTTKNLIPLPFTGTNSLVSFTISLDFRSQWHIQEGGIPIASLMSFLSSCPALETFSLKLDKCKNFVASEMDQPVEISSVTAINLRFRHCRSAVVRALISDIRFPNAETMRLVCDSRGRRSNSSMQCHDILQEVFPKPTTFPKLRNLKLDLLADGPVDSLSQEVDLLYVRPISIPFSNMLSLHDLEITTSHSFIRHLEDSVECPKLRSLSIVDCWKMDFDWFLDVHSRISAKHAGDALGGPDSSVVAMGGLSITVRGTPWEHQWEGMLNPSSEPALDSAFEVVVPFAEQDEPEGGEENVEDIFFAGDDQSTSSD
ncbi:hypothetical protein SCHPADRAFT_889556 [Schizopora paradoxa]|uniref:Uncharacterized protein n=1 Tax=Schizopora paradoxa TaxID=27342 RepID=A0A0H2RXA9_9AGAM|nr:hypothetical protein SCHPADRAFT_889556 [Schizopora paradoxa]